jgi:hypothetical protein
MFPSPFSSAVVLSVLTSAAGQSSFGGRMPSFLCTLHFSDSIMLPCERQEGLPSQICIPAHAAIAEGCGKTG